MDSGVTRHALRFMNAGCKISQQAARFSAASQVLRNRNDRPAQLYQPSLQKGYQKEYKKPFAPEAQRFRLLTDSINKDLSVSVEYLGVWVADFLRLSLHKLLDGSDSSEVVRILHNLDRKYRSDRDRKNSKELQTLVELVRQACQSSLIPSTSHVALHLLSYYKESGQFDKGLEFWDWLSKKDEAALDPVYAGAAIELLAVYGAGMDYCEDVYERTLAQQRDISSQYYLSPGAIIPDRSKAVTFKGTSMGLLQGILTARLFYGKWQHSYLTLDTAFMLRPTQVVSRVLDLFVHERPIFEALPVFYMYCRGGNAVRNVTLSTLLKSLKGLSSRNSDYSARIQSTRAMFDVVEAYVGSAGPLDTIHLNIITSAVCSVIPSQPSAMLINMADGRKDLTTMVVDLFTQLVNAFAQHNAPPNKVTFEEIISKALLLRYPEIASVAVQDMIALGTVPGESTVTEILTAVRIRPCCVILRYLLTPNSKATVLQDPELMKTAWMCIRKSDVLKQGDDQDLRRWRDVAAAARRCSLELFVENQLQPLAPEDPPQTSSAVGSIQEKRLETCGVQNPGHEPPSTDQMHAFEHLCSDISRILLRMNSSQPGKFRDFLRYPVDPPAIFKWPEVAEEAWQRKLYDELTFEENYKEAGSALADSEDSIPAFSDTGFRFDQLRYVNWKAINNLLAQAEAWERHVEASTDAAIKEQTAVPKTKVSSFQSSATVIRSPLTMQQLETFQRDVQTEQARLLTEEEWRNRVLRLRDANYTSRTRTNTGPLM
ncbi:MAG: hypothetical protein Q9216_001157 [Gyalolechia sp. 2 TL-2023]